jgi:hypothetical protein
MIQTNQQNYIPANRKSFHRAFPLCNTIDQCHKNCFNNDDANIIHSKRKHTNKVFHMSQYHYNNLTTLLDSNKIIFERAFLQIMCDRSECGKSQKIKYGIYVHKNDLKSNDLVQKAKHNKMNLGKMILEMYFNENTRLCFKMYDRTNLCDCGNIHLTDNGLIYVLESERHSKKADDCDAAIESSDSLNGEKSSDSLNDGSINEKQQKRLKEDSHDNTTYCAKRQKICSNDQKDIHIRFLSNLE